MYLDIRIDYYAVDAVYEGAQKRTFLISAVVLVLYLPFIVEFIVLFRKLGPQIQRKDQS